MDRWCQLRAMRIDDYYRLDIAKTRVISKIILVSKEDSYPAEFKLEIQVTKNSSWKSMGIYTSEDGKRGYMEVKFDKPYKIRAMNFIITKPRLEPKSPSGLSPAWSIFDIRLTEVLFFGEFGHRTIGKR